MELDRNLHFGIIALQVELIDAGQFAEACAAWAIRKGAPLAQVLVDRGWISAGDRSDIDRILDRRLAKHGGDVRASLAAVAEPALRQAIRSVVGAEQSAAIWRDETPPAMGPLKVETARRASPKLLGERIPQSHNARLENHSRYTLSRLHAEGGLGQVWVAVDKDLNREVALKELRPEQAGHPDASRRFLMEAQITGQLEHPNIVPIYELARRDEAGPLFYTMKLVRGRTLRDAIADYHQNRKRGKSDPLELPRLLQAFVNVAQGIAYAHSRGVIHRDLKPSNVILGSFGEVIVLDWGLAKLVGAEDTAAATLGVGGIGEMHVQATAAGIVLGTPAYMAPEQAAGKLELLNVLTDIYGLGAILYEILTGNPPHGGRDTAQILDRIVTGDTPLACAADPSVPPPLGAICAKAMAKQQSDRYAKAAQLADDVQRWLADEPVSAYIDPWSASARRWMNRHRVLVGNGIGLAFAAMILLAVVTAVSERARLRTDVERGKAVQARNEAVANHERAKEQQLLAEANFRIARDAVDQFYTKISQNKLLGVPRMEPLRKELLITAKDFYETLTRQRSHDPSLRGELARAYSRLALIIDATEANSKALNLFDKAHSIFQELAQAEPNKEEHQVGLAECYENIGRVRSRRAETATAEAAFDSALRIWRQLAQRGNQPFSMQRRLPYCLSELAYIYQNTGRPADAEKIFQEARSMHIQLAEQNPNSIEAQRDLALAQHNLGNFYYHTSRIPEAIRAFEAALAILSDTESSSYDVAWFRAAALNHLGELYRLSNRPDEAQQALQQSGDIYDALLNDFPDWIELEEQAISVQNNLGRLHYYTGNLTEAEKAYRRALSGIEKLVINKGGTDRTHGLIPVLINLAKVQRDTGQFDAARNGYARAQQFLENAVRSNEDLIASQVALARVHEGVGRLEKEAGRLDQAIDRYRQVLTTLEPVLARDPQNVDARRYLRDMYEGRADVWATMNRPTEALADWEQAVAFDNGEFGPKFRLGRALALARTGNVQAAIEGIEKILSETEPPASPTAVAASRVYAVSIAVNNNKDSLSPDEKQQIASRYRARAISLLQRAHAAGYLDNPKHRSELIDHSDFAPLRSSREFQELVEKQKP